MNYSIKFPSLQSTSLYPVFLLLYPERIPDKNAVSIVFDLIAVL